MLTTKPWRRTKEVVCLGGKIIQKGSHVILKLLCCLNIRIQLISILKHLIERASAGLKFLVPFDYIWTNADSFLRRRRRRARSRRRRRRSKAHLWWWAIEKSFQQEIRCRCWNAAVTNINCIFKSEKECASCPKKTVHSLANLSDKINNACTAQLASYGQAVFIQIHVSWESCRARERRRAFEAYFSWEVPSRSTSYVWLAATGLCADLCHISIATSWVGIDWEAFL